MINKISDANKILKFNKHYPDEQKKSVDLSLMKN